MTEVIHQQGAAQTAPSPSKTVIAWDTETRGLDWFDPNQQAFLATFADAEREWYETTNIGVKQHFDELDVLVAHNLSFDWHQTRARWGVDLAQYVEDGLEVHDTDIMSRLLFPEGQRKGERGGHGLKNLATVYIDPEAAAAEDVLKELAAALGHKTLKKQGVYYDLFRAYPEQLLEYALKDARYTYDLFQLFLPRLQTDPKLWELYQLEMKVAPVLIQAEARGTKVDPDAVRALQKEYLKRQKQGLKVLTETYDMPENALGGEGSEDALLTWLLEHGVPLHRRTDTGKLQTSRWALQEFADEFPVLDEFLQYRITNKFLSTYIDPMLNRDVVHPSFMQVGAWTGRMSCRRPNMQNIPVRQGNDVRNVFVARPGHKLVVSDYDQLELRLLAYYLGPTGESYRQMIRDGHDAHAWMAAEIHGGDPADYAKGTAGQPLRDNAKHTLFAIGYGAGGKRVCDMNNLPTGPPYTADDWMVKNGYGEVGQPSFAQGRALANTIKTGIPGYKRLTKRLKEKVELSGFVTTIGGRKQPVARDKAYVAVSAIIQGSGADIIKMALVEVANTLKAYDGDVLMIVHDELVSEVPEKHADEALRLQNQAMELAYDLDPPLRASGKIVDRYGEAK